MSDVATHSQSTTTPILKRLISGHPLIAFFVIAFAGTWIAFLPLVLAQNGLGLFPYTIPEIGPYPPSYWFAMLGALLGPTLASFTVTAITTGKAGDSTFIAALCSLACRSPLVPLCTRWRALVPTCVREYLPGDSTTNRFNPAVAVILYDIPAKPLDYCCCCANLGRRRLVWLCSA